MSVIKNTVRVQMRESRQRRIRPETSQMRNTTTPHIPCRQSGNKKKNGRTVQIVVSAKTQSLGRTLAWTTSRTSSWGLSSIYLGTSIAFIEGSSCGISIVPRNFFPIRNRHHRLTPLSRDEHHIIRLCDLDRKVDGFLTIKDTIEVDTVHLPRTPDRISHIVHNLHRILIIGILIGDDHDIIMHHCHLAKNFAASHISSSTRRTNNMNQSPASSPLLFKEGLRVVTHYFDRFVHRA